MRRLKALAALAALVSMAPVGLAQDVAAPPPIATPTPPDLTPDEHDPALRRYQACFQRMVDGQHDEAFMRRCLRRRKKDPAHALPAPSSRAPAAVASLARGLDDADIVVVFRKNLPALRRCYEDFVARSGSPGGRLGLDLNVDAAGRVGEVGFRALSPDVPALRTCFTRRLRAWTFPAPDGGATIVHIPEILLPAGAAKPSGTAKPRSTPRP
jgi:hypothetical protein